jgi:hypothetical protein
MPTNTLCQVGRVLHPRMRWKGKREQTMERKRAGGVYKPGPHLHQTRSTPQPPYSNMTAFINRNLDILWLLIQQLLQSPSPTALYYFLAANPVALALFRDQGHGFAITRARLSTFPDGSLRTMAVVKSHREWQEFLCRFSAADFADRNRRPGHELAEGQLFRKRFFFVRR